MAERNTKKPEEEAPQQQSNGGSLPKYVEAAARLSTSRPLGASKTDFALTTLVQYDGGPAHNVSSIGAVPGIIVANFLPTYGVSKTPVSPINRASFSEFNAIRSKISGNRPYEPVDHMIYRACVDSLRELYYAIARAYLTLSQYPALNLYRPEAILTAMGFDYGNWLEQAPRVYQWLLTHATALRPFPTVPLGSVSQRHLEYNTSYYTDGEAETSQTYIMNQVAYYSYEVVDEAKGITLRKRGSTVDDVLNLWEDMYRALQASSDVYIIAADIRRAFEDKVVTELAAPSPDTKVSYAKMDPFLTSLMNTATVGINVFDQYVEEFAAVLDAFRIYDGRDGGNLYCIPDYRKELTLTSDNAICVPGNIGHLNFVQQSPSTQDILDACRFHPCLVSNVIGDVDANSEQVTVRCTVSSMGTEVITSFVMYQMNPETGRADSRTDFGSVVIRRNTALNGTSAYLSLVSSLLANFDWHPALYAVSLDRNDVENSSLLAIQEDIQNYVPITEQNLAQIHEANLLHAFGITD